MAEIVDRLHHESVTYGNGFAIKSETDFANCTGKITAVKIKTNADRIRAMSDEELADRIMGYVRCEACEKEFHIECDPLMTCRGIWLEWLKSNAES